MAEISVYGVWQKVAIAGQTPSFLNDGVFPLIYQVVASGGLPTLQNLTNILYVGQGFTSLLSGDLWVLDLYPGVGAINTVGGTAGASGGGQAVTADTAPAGYSLLTGADGSQLTGADGSSLYAVG